jgi:GDP-L-fucose synthase
MKRPKILITGGHGLLGSALYDELYKLKKYNIKNPTSRVLNLLDEKATEHYFKTEGPFECVFHLAAKVGGVKANTEFVADFFDINTKMNLNVLNAAKHKTKKLVSVLSTCIYPDSDYVKYPLTEYQLHMGPPHSSNFGYAYSKRMLEVQSRAYRQQFGLNAVCAIPNNLFGENDNYHLENGHVIPSLIRKIYEAKKNNEPMVEIWGSGRPLREFTYSVDAGRILINLMNGYDSSDPINIGNTNEFSISFVAESIKELLNYEGTLVYNSSRPEGQLRKPSSNEKLLHETSWKTTDYTDFKTALKNSCDWFVKRYPYIRGIND